MVINPVTGNPVAGAIVYVEKIKAGAVTNDVGFLFVDIAKRAVSVGMQDDRNAVYNKKCDILFQWDSGY